MNLIQDIKPVTPTELQQWGVACSLSLPQKPLCIVGRAVPLTFYFSIIAILNGIPRGSPCGEERLVTEDSCFCFLISDVSWRCGCGVGIVPSPLPLPSFIFWLSFNFSRGQKRKSHQFLSLSLLRNRSKTLVSQAKEVSLIQNRGVVYHIPAFIDCEQPTFSLKIRRDLWQGAFGTENAYSCVLPQRL